MVFYLQKDLLLERTEALVLAHEVPLDLLQQMLDLEAVAGNPNASLKVTLLHVLPQATPALQTVTMCVLILSLEWLPKDGKQASKLSPCLIREVQASWIPPAIGDGPKLYKAK
jgi:hypothetical protein